MTDVVILLNFLILTMFIVLMLFLYVKYFVYELIVVILLFSLIIGVYSISITPTMPLTPWFQIFFILFQFVIWLLATIDNYDKRV